jgi:hypothetical protein
MPTTPITLAVDQDGSLITRGADEWLICFVPPIKPQWWHWLTISWMKHCFAIKEITPDCWLLFEPWWSRMMVCTLTKEQANQFLAWGRRGNILAVQEQIPGQSSQLRGWMTCAALVAHLLGRKYWVWTPYQLHARLMAEPDVWLVSQRSLKK